MRKRQFSVPYNGDDPERFLERLLPYREYVHDVYTGCPGIMDFFTPTLSSAHPDYYENCLHFLALAKENKIPCVLTLNDQYNGLYPDEKEAIVKTAEHYVKKYDIFGVVCSDFEIAEMIHIIMPDVEINTSCNNAHYRLCDLEEWKNNIGITLVNPPRDSVRNLSWLRELKKAGFRIKLLVNEFCYLNCPNMVSFCSVSKLKRSCRPLKNPLLTCTLYPEQLPTFDEVVDIYKIQGRIMDTDYIFNILDIYITGRAAKMSELKSKKHSTLIAGDFSSDEIDPKMFEIWNSCSRQCYNCGLCNEEWNRILSKKKGE